MEKIQIIRDTCDNYIIHKFKIYNDKLVNSIINIWTIFNIIILNDNKMVVITDNENIDDYDEEIWFDSVKYKIKFPDRIYKVNKYVGNLIYDENNDYEDHNEIKWCTDKDKSKHENDRYHYSKGGKKGKGLFIKEKSNSSALNNENNFVNEFNDNLVFRKELCDKLNTMDSSLKLDYIKSKMFKLNRKCMPDHKIIQTSEWDKYKYKYDTEDGSKEKSPTPKTDVCIICNDKIITISLKSGQGRLTSADRYEFNAVFKSVSNSIKYLNDTKLQEYVESITINMLSLEKHISEDNYTTLSKKINDNQDVDESHREWIKKLHNTCKECLNLWKKIKKYNEEFINDILYECATGKLKFSDNIGKAEWFITTKGSNLTEIKNIYKLNKRTNKLDDYLKKCLPCDTSIFACKSSKNKLWCRFL